MVSRKTHEVRGWHVLFVSCQFEVRDIDGATTFQAHTRGTSRSFSDLREQLVLIVAQMVGVSQSYEVVNPLGPLARRLSGNECIHSALWFTSVHLFIMVHTWTFKNCPLIGGILLNSGSLPMDP